MANTKGIAFILREVQEYVQAVLRNLSTATTALDYKSIFLHVLGDFCRLLVFHSKGRPPTADEAIVDQQAVNLFWTAPTAYTIYLIVLLAGLTRRWWILHGISLILLDCVLVTVSKWILYSLDDRELRAASKRSNKRSCVGNLRGSSQ